MGDTFLEGLCLKKEKTTGQSPWSLCFACIALFRWPGNAFSLDVALCRPGPNRRGWSKFGNHRWSIFGCHFHIIRDTSWEVSPSPDSEDVKKGGFRTETN